MDSKRLSSDRDKAPAVQEIEVPLEVDTEPESTLVLEKKDASQENADAAEDVVTKNTDFYQIQDDEADKMGFPPGVAQNCMQKMYKKWEKQARQDHENYSNKRLSSDGDKAPAEGNDTEPESTLVLEKKDASQENADAAEDEVTKNSVPEEQNPQSAGESYNGAIRDNYRWTQSILDLDVQIPVPAYITKARDVHVNITATYLSVAIRGDEPQEWKTLVDGELCWQTNKADSMWSLEPGKHIQVHFEKTKERWWDAVLLSEPKIDLSNIDATRPMEDLGQDEQMKIQELMWNQERKRQGLPTTDEMETQKLLKEVWNVEGSPFLGTEFDPSLVNVGNSSPAIPEDSSDSE
ncbi:NudC domain-containing protein 3 [Zootermopsis nevadensis]|uniref:NudC domain-containing protein 3 n=1 Tax=Zootermopsis nevadensis TaxID=136037 RepID=A0A067QZ33_ZOONE|nr:NudC domain-containing protein 3 [Zootermopsis nevadensis]